MNLDPEPPLYKGETEEPNELLAALMVTALKDLGLSCLLTCDQPCFVGRGKFPFTETELLIIASNFHDDPKSLLESSNLKIRDLYKPKQNKR